MDRLWINAADYDYDEYDRRQAEKFIQTLYDKGMIREVLREVSALEKIDDTTSEWVLLWAQMLKAQRAQKEALENIKEAKNFESIRWKIQKDDKVRQKKQKWVKSCIYCGTGHPPGTVPCLGRDL